MVAAPPQARVATVAARTAILRDDAIAPTPAYYRPVIADGKAFPVSRSNFLSYVEFPDSWHDPRLRFINGTWQLVGVHEGIDIYGEQGTPIVSMTPGVVETSGWSFYSGLRVGVRGSDGRFYFYAHMTSIADGIDVGAHVDTGTVLGLLGNTGYGPPGERDQFPPHLHFGIQVGDEWVDPYATLVSLYAATVKAQEAAQARLDALAATGKNDEWQRQAAEVFMRPAPPPGE